MKEEADFTIYADGGARGNPGPAAYGFVVYDSNSNKIFEEGKTIGNTTNNFAEYSGVVAALKWLFESPVLCPPSSVIQVFLDSQLAARQLSGKWKIKNENLRNLYFTVKELEQKLGAKINYLDIPREENRESDRLVNLALDGKI